MNRASADRFPPEFGVAVLKLYEESDCRGMERLAEIPQ